MRALALLRSFARVTASALGDVLSPPTCAACDAVLGRKAVFCAACAVTVVPAVHARGPFPVAASVAFGGAVALAIRRLKYEDRPDLAGPLGHLARRAIASDRGRVSPDIVVPVPLHAQRLAERGYNQAALIASEVANELEVPLRARAILRRRNTPKQARLDRAARLLNVAGAFEVPDPRVVAGRFVLLVDDVATSGATLVACRSALISAGATRVDALVVARAE